MDCKSCAQNNANVSLYSVCNLLFTWRGTYGTDSVLPQSSYGSAARIVEDERKSTVEHAPRIGARLSEPGQAELGSIAPRTKAQRARATSSSSELLCDAHYCEILRERYTAALDIEKTTMVHYARAFRSALVQPRMPSESLRFSSYLFTLSIIANLLFADQEEVDVGVNSYESILSV